MPLAKRSVGPCHRRTGEIQVAKTQIQIQLSRIIPRDTNTPLHTIMAHHKSVRDFSFTYYKNLSKTFVNFSSLHSFYGKLKNNPDHIVNVKGDKILFTFDTANFVYEKYFIDSIKNRLLYDRSYYVLIKIRHDDDLYKMAGK